MNRFHLRSFRHGLWLAMALANSVAAVELTVEDPWIREAPPNARALAGYLTLRNPGAADIRLRDVTSAQFDKVEMHLTRITDGRASMQHLDELTIPAHGSVKFEPNSYHLMLIKPHAPLRAGMSVEWTLHWDDGSTQTVQAIVRSATQQ